MWQHRRSPRARCATRGELWDVAPGVTGLRGDAAALFAHARATHRRRCAWARRADEWRVPPAIDFATLARADYFASLPQWLTLASHLSDRRGRAARAWPSMPSRRCRARSVDAADGRAQSRRVLPRLRRARRPDARHAGDRDGAGRLLAPRGRATRVARARMGVHDARGRLHRTTSRRASVSRAVDRARVATCARRSASTPTIAVATDPFFAPTARAKQLLQRIKELKHELLLPIGESRTTAAASFNLHDTFFGEAFDIRLPDGRPATTACVAFGIERWTLAFLAAHGPDASRWPAIPALVELAEVLLCLTPSRRPDRSTRVMPAPPTVARGPSSATFVGRRSTRGLALAQPDILAKLRDAALIESFHPVNLSRLIRLHVGRHRRRRGVLARDVRGLQALPRAAHVSRRRRLRAGDHRRRAAVDSRARRSRRSRSRRSDDAARRVHAERAPRRVLLSPTRRTGARAAAQGAARAHRRGRSASRPVRVRSDRAADRRAPGARCPTCSAPPRASATTAPRRWATSRSRWRATTSRFGRSPRASSGCAARASSIT